MKVLAINGSPRKNGNTATLLTTVLEVCEKAGLETELYQAGGRDVHGCRGCAGCRQNKGRCAIDDWINELYPKMKAADAIALGSPTYFFDISSEIKSVIDRTGYISRADGFSFSRKVAVGVSAVRRAGGITTLDSMQRFFLINDMIVPGSTYLNMSLACNPGDAEKDDEGMKTMRRLGENIVWLLEKLHETL
ncbi:MAG: flavodoxin family protein [Treponema sp.]|jgi:multimeric flavodoxin WrbA|nr:flavodoxin family protein [Treponema sp.]